MARIKYYNQETQSWEYADVAGGVIPSYYVTETELDTAVSSKITAPTTATVGQILRVKAVDTNGAPTEWEAVNIIPTYTTSNNGQVLGVVDGALAWVSVS